MARNLDFELLPADDDDAITPEAELDAAESSATEPAVGAAQADEPPEPYGMTWLFDPDTRRMRRSGSAPTEVRGLDALRMWCLVAVHTARFAHDAFSDDFGMERPNDPIGEVVVEERISDYEDRLREALLVHDRIEAVEDFDADFDPDAGILYIQGFTVITTDEKTLPFADLLVETMTYA